MAGSDNPSEAYFKAILRDLARLDKGVRFWLSSVQEYQQKSVTFANDPVRLAVYAPMLENAKKVLENWNFKYSYRILELILFNREEFAEINRFCAWIFLDNEPSSWMERATRLDPDLLEGDVNFFGGP